ncbi:MAG: imidazole glycerol phosphate synthase subunit HisH [Fimbriimonadales bacterium]
MIAVVDYGAGNLRSVCNALDLFGHSYRIATTPGGLNDANGIILPGVGHFGSMMRSLNESGMATGLQAEAAESTPLLGICLGMQALFDSSEEAPGVAGLCLFNGEVRRFPFDMRVPHMGWNEVLFQDGEREDFYFAHSFYAPIGPHTAGWTEYGGLPFSSIVWNGNVSGVQFHPEKSGGSGLTHLEAWCRQC